MTKTIRLALIGLSILSLASPALARTVNKADRLSCYQTASGAWLCNLPVALQDRSRDMRAPQGMIRDFNPNAGYDYPAPLAVGGDVL